MTDLQTEIRDALSPEAVALILANIQGATCKDKTANMQVRWFANQLTEVCGGPEAVNALFEEIGV